MEGIIEEVSNENFKRVHKIISSMLNRVPAGDGDPANYISIRYSNKGDKFSGKEKIIPSLCKVVQNNIFCDVDLWVLGSKLEENQDPQLVVHEEEDKLLIEVKPLPLGYVALISVPKIRSESHPVPVNPRNWGNSLGCVPWFRWHATPVTYWQLKDGCVTEESSTFRALQKVVRENRFVEHKLPNSLVSLEVDVLKKYLLDSCTPILNGLQSGFSAELWLGIEDSTSVVIGVPSIDLSSSLCTALCQYASKITPPLLKSQISISIFSIDWPEDSMWLNVKCLRVSSAEGFSILKAFLGVCRFYELDIDDYFVVEIPDSLWFATIGAQFKIERHVEISRDGDSWLDVVSKNVTTILTKTADSGEDRNWVSRTTEWFVPNEVDYYDWTKIERKVAKICFSTDSETEGSYYVHDVDNNNFPGFAPLRSNQMSNLQLWLRLKGFKGAEMARTYIPLCGRAVGKVLVAASSTDRNLLVRSLRNYMDGINVTVDVESEGSFLDLENISILRMYSIIYIITTYEAWSQCESIHDALCAGRTIKIILFIDLESARDDMWIKVKDHSQKIVDVVLLANTNAYANVENLSSSVDDILFDNLYSNAFERVPNAISSVDMSSVKRFTIDWINRSIRCPTWEMVQADYVFSTNMCSSVQDNIVKMHRSRRKSEFQRIKIYQSHPGSGATAMMHRIAWNLQNQMNMATCFLLNDKVNEAAVNSFLQYITCTLNGRWIVVFVDTDVVNRNIIFPAFYGRQATNACVTVVEFVAGDNSTNPNSQIIDPILGIQDVKYLTDKLTELFTDSAQALRELFEYTSKNPDECENRHIYVIMLFATMGKFEPVKLLLENEVERLSDDTHVRKLINFLALLAGYCPTLSSMPRNKFPDAAFRAPLLTMWHSKTDIRIAFRHPFLARKYLDVLRSKMHVEYSQLSSLLLEAEDVTWIGVFGLDAPTKIAFYRDLLQMRWPNHHWPFSMFVCRLLNENDTDVLLSFLSNDSRCPIDKGHRQILLSRIYRALLNIEKSIELANEAEVTFRNTSNHNLACSNLGEAYGFAAVHEARIGNEVAKNQYVIEMEKWFSECQNNKQLQKWQDELKSTELANIISGLDSTFVEKLDVEEILHLIYQSRHISLTETNSNMGKSKTWCSLTKDNSFYMLADPESE